MSQQDPERELQSLYQSGGSSATTEQERLQYMRQISIPLATQLLNQIGLDETTTASFTLADSGCGSGIVAEVLHTRISQDVLARSKVLCGDVVAHQVEFVNDMIKKSNWVNTEARIMDAQDTALDAASFSHVTMNMVLLVVPDSKKALAEAIRILEPGGILGFTAGHRDSSGWGYELECAFLSFPFKAPYVKRLQATKWGEWYDVNWIRRTLEDTGLEDVKVEVFSTLIRMENADYFVSRNAMMIEWVMNTDWSEELRKEHGRDEVFELIRQFLDRKYQGRPFDLTVTAIIASGRVPKKVA
ncbi:S-adenosyl-L-methionine-dependent methyltransferase [Thozetella sp. PMI_491]|nr:S-adenosyl-L-methionine-dependent methyltransferase [Thozetella sp. PMI_491]